LRRERRGEGLAATPFSVVLRRGRVPRGFLRFYREGPTGYLTRAFINGDLNIYLVPLFNKASRLTRSIGRRGLAPEEYTRILCFRTFFPASWHPSGPGSISLSRVEFSPESQTECGRHEAQETNSEGFVGVLSPLASSVPRVSRVLPWPLTRA